MDLAEINNQILTRMAEYEKLNQSVEGTGMGIGNVLAQQGQIKKMAASELGLLQARALGLQGNIQAAQQAVDRAIDLKYSVYEAKLNTYQYQLDAIKDDLSKEEQIQAEARQAWIADQKEKVAEQKAEAKDKEKLSILAIQNGADKALSDMISNAGSLTEAMQIAGELANTGGWQYVATPKERDQLIAQGYEITQSGGRTYARPMEDELLSVAEAKSLGVPYGTTRNQAIKMGINQKAISGGGGGGGGSTTTETGDTFTDTINYLKDLRDRGTLNDFNYQEQVNALAEINPNIERGKLESMVNQAMEGTLMTPQEIEQDNNPSSDFDIGSQKTYKEKGLGTFGTDVPTYLESLEETLEPISPLKWFEKGYKGIKKYLTGK
jgi:hypothetical protein